LQALNFRKGAYFKGKNGMMYFGGINGFNSFNPNSFVKNEVPPKVELTGFKLFNNEVGVGEKILGKAVLNKNISETNEIVLKHGHNSFSFEFSAMHYASPKQNNYMYMLDGFDKDWIPTNSKRRFVTYANLDSKDYVFKVIASNSDNVWNLNARELKLKVLPALWKTWWAYTIFILFTVFLMWLFRRNILVRAEYRNSLKIEKLEKNKIKVLNKMKLEFFTNISHEFKTPLTLILGPLQNLLKMEIVDSKLKESLLIMDRNANYLFRLINQVMDFRKVETNQLKVITSKGNLVDFCEEVVLSFNVLANEKNLNLSFESSEPELIVYFDWDKMDKILNNLISNSIKYTPDSGNIKVSLSFINNGISKKSNVLDVRSEIEIIVEDTGVGIPKNQISKVFKRFYQVEDSNKSNSFGSGVGLALTKKLIDLLQGHIKVKSNHNEGSQFIVRFPVITSKNDLMREAEISSEEVIFSESGLVINENIHKEIGDSIKTLPSLLIVEDNPDMQTFLKSSLEGSYKILQAYDGVQGLKIALENIPNIIISDVMMPNMDGIQFCNEIKQNEITNHIPIILLSARASIDHKIEGLKVGADVYIPKPFDMRLLKIKTQKLLEEREFLIEKFASKRIILDSQKIGINHTEKAFLEKAEKVIEDNLTNSEFGVEDLGRALSFSRMQLYRKFKSVRGLSANEFIRAYRIKKAALLLRETDLNVSEILYTIGFTNRSYFAKCFKKSFDMSPKEYSTKHREKLKRERDSEIE
jgi:signal transduction histidine kinase/DNA-binding response OmpR family regulator